ncbi:fructose-6-phosphate aldolase [Persicobacter psychrovividus]|uniref:Transaldolase n=1 Tax=Persicobacter psychrovividus TaxID=387638 RepID=A0ABN6L942_9BACT|nr:putative transaldolase [Persicobacter psychrovividus]
MKFFIDTALLSEIEEAASLGILDGVTTNPSLMAKVGIQGQEAIYQHYKKICDLVDNNVSAEVISTDFEGMMKEADALAGIDEKIVVKIPMIPDGVKAIKKLSGMGARTNCTLVFSAGQALVAAKAGATYVSPFLGRLDDISMDSMEMLGQIVNIYQNYNFQTEILGASVRHPMHVITAAEMGVDVVTASLKTLKALFQHPLTDVGLEKFLADYQKSQK